MIAHPPVKINLGLNVLRKRPDGFHDLETLFVKSEQYSDTLEIVAGDDYSRTLSRLVALYGENSSVQGVSDEEAPQLAQGISPDGKLMITVARREGVDWDVLSDLCAKAYMLLDKDFHLPPVKIFLEKNSPVGAGLGGGSADAAYALKMLDNLFSLGLPDSSLAEYASVLGSDCAFFIYNVPMTGEGRGEILAPYNLPVRIVDAGTDAGIQSGTDGKEIYELQIVVPEGIHVSTAEAYRGIVPAEPEIPLKDVLNRPVSEWKDLLVNDFEKAVFKAHPELAAIKQSLYDSGAVYASMSGSGSALFALYRL
ncbi:MAG: 4-(cytidine 5'-diphospho)-2-C-methyl-D-erythritol kinase [Candidatus Cryptobacteroides sp.]